MIYHWYILSILSLYIFRMVALFIFNVGVNSFIAIEKSLSRTTHFWTFWAFDTAFTLALSRPSWIREANELVSADRFDKTCVKVVISLWPFSLSHLMAMGSKSSKKRWNIMRLIMILNYEIQYQLNHVLVYNNSTNLYVSPFPCLRPFEMLKER